MTAIPVPPSNQSLRTSKWAIPLTNSVNALDAGAVALPEADRVAYQSPVWDTYDGANRWVSSGWKLEHRLTYREAGGEFPPVLTTNGPYGSAWGSVLQMATGQSEISAVMPGTTAFGTCMGGAITAGANYGYGSTAFGFTIVGTIQGSGYGSLAAGYAAYGGSISTSAGGCLAFGYTEGHSAVASGTGSVVLGFFAEADATASGSGSVQINGGDNAVANSLHVGTGIRLHGAVATPAAPANGDIWLNANHVYVQSDGVAVKQAHYVQRTLRLVPGGDIPPAINTDESGCSAWGYVNQAPTGISEINAIGFGTTAFGFVQEGQLSTSGFGSVALGAVFGGEISANDYGALAGGLVFSSTIRSEGLGSMAFGYNGSLGDVLVSGDGGVALGYFGGDTTVSGAGAIQFNTGDNAVDNSLHVGNGIRLHGTVATPATPANGDIWLNAGYVYIRSNGVSKKIV